MQRGFDHVPRGAKHAGANDVVEQAVALLTALRLPRHRADEFRLDPRATGASR